FSRCRPSLVRRHRMSCAVRANSLRHRYSTSRLERLLGTAGTLADLGSELLPQLYEREVEYLCREEFARTAQDILWRRTKLGLHLLNVDTGPLERWLEAGGGAA